MSTNKKAGSTEAPIPSSQPVKKSAEPQWFKPSKPNFVKLKENEQVAGIFMGVKSSAYGRAYRFTDHDGAVFTIGGNRAQLDTVFDDLLGNPIGFQGDTIIGHALIIARGENIESRSKRKVAQFFIGHDFARCPKGCTSQE